jgi:hypothetical protein
MLTVEVWYVDGDRVEVHPDAAALTGDTAYPAALAEIRETVTEWHRSA